MCLDKLLQRDSYCRNKTMLRYMRMPRLFTNTNSQLLKMSPRFAFFSVRTVFGINDDTLVKQVIPFKLTEKMIVQQKIENCEVEMVKYYILADHCWGLYIPLNHLCTTRLGIYGWEVGRLGWKKILPCRKTHSAHSLPCYIPYSHLTP